MKKLHYSWVICLSGALLMFAAVGLTITAFSVYQPYIISVNGFSNTQASVLMTIRSIFTLVALLFVEVFYRRLNLRLGMAITVLLAAGRFFMYSVSRGYLMYCVSSALSGVAYAMGGMIPVSLLISRWFRDKVGLALGICSAGTGVSAVLIPPVVTRMIEKHSLSTAFMAEGCFILLLAVLMFVLVRNSPADKGLTPLRSAEKAPAVQRAAPKREGLINLDRRTFCMMVAATALLSALGNTGYCHLAVLYSREGYSADAVASIISVAGFALIVGKCIYGEITDKIGGYRSNVFSYGLTLLGGVLCSLAGLGWLPLAYLAMLALNIGIPISTVGMSVWAHDLSDGAHYARNLKWFQMSYALGGLALNTLPGAIADLTGSYVPAYILFTGMMAVSFAMVQMSYRRNRRRAAAAGLTENVRRSGNAVRKARV